METTSLIGLTQDGKLTLVAKEYIARVEERTTCTRILLMDRDSDYPEDITVDEGIAEIQELIEKAKPDTTVMSKAYEEAKLKKEAEELILSFYKKLIVPEFEGAKIIEPKCGIACTKYVLEAPVSKNSYLGIEQGGYYSIEGMNEELHKVYDKYRENIKKVSEHIREKGFSWNADSVINTDVIYFYDDVVMHPKLV